MILISGEGTVINLERQVLLPIILTEGRKDHEALRFLRYLPQGSGGPVLLQRTRDPEDGSSFPIFAV